MDTFACCHLDKKLNSLMEFGFFILFFGDIIGRDSKIETQMKKLGNGFLNDNLYLWMFMFAIWLIGLISLYDYLPIVVANILVQGSVTLIIALFAGMLAIHHMDLNERKKLARQQYEDLISLMVGLHERYSSLEKIHNQIFDNIYEESHFTRGMRIPYVIFDVAKSDLELPRKAFILAQGKNRNDRNFLNLIHITELESDYQLLMYQLERRNELFKQVYLPLAQKAYKGGGISQNTSNQLQSEIPFVAFSDFLQMSEFLLKHIDERLRQFIEVIDALVEESTALIPRDILDEKLGVGKKLVLDIPQEIRDALKSKKYRELEASEREKLFAKDYPEYKFRMNSYNKVQLRFKGLSVT